jgi:4-carboxymuconolactone decarboxylase
VTRIPYPDPASLPEADRKFLESLPQLNISRLLAGSPSMFQPLTRVFSAYLNEGKLTPELREIAILRVGFLLNSEYEVFNHRRAARVIGMTADRIEAVLSKDPATSGLFNEQETLVLSFVDEVIQLGAATEQTFYATEKTMTTAELVELSVVIGVYTLVSQVCATFGLEPEEVPIAETGMEDIGRAVDKLTQI